MIAIDDSNMPYVVTSERDKVLLACFQELMLWVEENPINIERGVDYQAIFEQAAFLKQELEKVTEYHAANFEEIAISEPVYDNEAEVIRVKIRFVHFDNTTTDKELEIIA